MLNTSSCRFADAISDVGSKCDYDWNKSLSEIIATRSLTLLWYEWRYLRRNINGIPQTVLTSRSCFPVERCLCFCSNPRKIVGEILGKAFATKGQRKELKRQAACHLSWIMFRRFFWTLETPLHFVVKGIGKSNPWLGVSQECSYMLNWHFV